MKTRGSEKREGEGDAAFPEGIHLRARFDPARIFIGFTHILSTVSPSERCFKLDGARKRLSPPPHSPHHTGRGLQSAEMYNHSVLTCDWNKLRQMNSEAPRTFGILSAMGARHALRTAMSRDKQGVALCLATPARGPVDSLWFTVAAD